MSMHGAQRSDKIEQYALLAVIGGGLYLLWKAKQGLEKIADPIAEVIADSYLSITLPGEMKLTGTAILPNGARVSMSQVAIIDPTNLIFQFIGLRYKIIRREGDTYITVRA